MESVNNIICPVCTLYLRPGITLESHLTSHPKQKVIEALIKVSQLSPQGFEKLLSNNLPSTSDTSAYPQLPTNVTTSHNWNHPTPINVAAMPPNMNQVPTNHSFIYQQFMSSSATQPILNVNPMTQQFVAVPTVINPQMFCSPYVFQQQQQLQIVSTNPNIQPILPRQPISIINNDIALSTAGNVSTNVVPTTTISSLKQHVDNSTSTEPEIPCDNVIKPDTVQNNEGAEELIDEENKDESIEVYPDMYAAVDATDTFEEDLDTSEIIILTSDKSCELDNIVETEEIDNEVEIIETIDISKEDEIIISGRSEDNDNEELMRKPLDLLWETVQDDDDDDDLDKACQTNHPPEFETVCVDTKHIKSSVEYITAENYCPSDDVHSSEQDAQETYKVTVPSSTIHVETGIYTISSHKENSTCMASSSSLLIPNDSVTLLEIDDMNFMISNDFIHSGKTILSKVDDYECIKDADCNKVIMNIGEERCSADVDQKHHIKKFCDEKLGEESMSRESLNIHADERMPPRGELSEQESNGASDVVWGKVYHEQECSSGMSTSYDLLARESWEASDCSDSEMPPLQSRIPPPSIYIPEKEPDIVTLPKKIAPVVSYNCTMCTESFTCPKERRVHQSKEHGASSNSGIVKKLKIRQARRTLKTPEIKEENNFELFAKMEPTDEPPEIEESSAINEDNQLNSECQKIKREKVLCPMCGELCPSSKEYNKHLQDVHKIINEKNKCKTCLEMFPSEVKFTEHLKIHPLECNLCGKNFYRRYNLRIHLKRHYNIRPYKCETCGKGFLTKQKLQEHNNVHTRVAPIKCTMCEETFRRHSNLVQHRNKHHFNMKKKYKDYVCHCGEVFHSKNKLSWHKEIHDTKPKSCTFCHEKFVHMSSLTRHIRRSHNQNYVPKGKKDTENVECHICKGVYFRNSLEVHLQTHTGRRQHACLICGKEFTTKWNLKLHRWTHASRTSKPFKCDQCNGAFIRQSDYQAHMNSHKSVRPYTCNYCGCKFIRKYNCQRHVREHEENKSYTCTVCNKSFHRSYYLKEHMRVHSGARPFACHICGKTSTTKSNHNKHMKIHHAREPVSTEG